MKKYRNPQTGEVFESITEAWIKWECPEPGCGGTRDSRCEFLKTICGGAWCRDHPTEAARLMGYEVIDFNRVNFDTVKEDKMSENKKPLAEWTLGEVKAECERIKGGCGNCLVKTGMDRGRGKCPFGNKVPAYWDLAGKPRWTEAEVMLAKGFVAAYPEGEIERRDEDTLWFQVPPFPWRSLPPGLFPSLRPGEKVRLADIVEAGPC